MDRLEAMVAVAFRRLHLRRLLMSIEKNPQMLEVYMPLDIRRPMELAGLRSQLARAKKQEADIAVTGRRFDAVLEKIDELHTAGRGHVGALEQQESELRATIESMVGASNGDPNDGETSSIASSEVGQIITGRPEGQA